MNSQERQDQIQVHTTALHNGQNKKLAFAGCGNCASCCDGSKFKNTHVMFKEVVDVAKLFPIVFLPRKDRKTAKMRLLYSLKYGVPCLYLDPGSKKCTIWNSGRPLVCKFYPFNREIIKKDGSSAHFKITYDRRCPGVQESADGGIHIFTADGHISEDFVDNFFGNFDLASYERDLDATNKCLGVIDELDLLVGVKVVIGRKPSPGGGLQNDFFHFLMINEKKLAALDGKSMQQLKAAGYINVINAHLRSLSNISKLIGAITAFEKSTQSINMLDFTFGS